MKALILAAGYGTRLASVAKDTAKPLLPINGKPMIAYIIDRIKIADDLSEIVVVSNNKFCDQFEAWAKSLKSLSIKVRVVNDGTNSPEERLGSIGDMEFVLSREKSADDWLVVGGDNLFDFDLRDFFRFARTKLPHPSIGLFDIKDRKAATKFGVVSLDADRRIVELQEKPAEPKSSLIAMCFYYFPKNMFKTIAEYRADSQGMDAAGGYIKWLAEKKRVYGFQFDGKWYDIGSIEALNDAQKHFKP
jgi:glucose-1-phosphate thymidylyltransferase